MSISTRLAKLEEATRGTPEQVLTKAERDAQADAWEASLLPVARTCASWQDLARHIRSLRDGDGGVVVSLDAARSENAVLDSTARSLFERARCDFIPSPWAS